MSINFKLKNHMRSGRNEEHILFFFFFFFESARIKCIHLFQRARFYGDFRAQIDYHIEGLFYLSEDVPLDKE